MEDLPSRKPFVLANWKMAMTVSESLSFVREFSIAVNTLARLVTIVLCPPYTSLYTVSHALRGMPVDLGAQNMCPASGAAHTGEISAKLVADAGCKWIMLGHWEIRRRTGETDKDINKKIHGSFQEGLRPIVLIGESTTERGQAGETIKMRLPGLFAGCTPGEIAQAAVIYEPEWTIGALEPAPKNHITESCLCIRRWIHQEFGARAAKKVRIIYGGSVAPENAGSLLSSPDLDGLGAGRMGRDPVSFAQIVRTIVMAKGLV